MGLGAAGLALPFARTLLARADTPRPPKRFIAFFTGNGTLPSAWRPTGSTSSFTLGPILRPLEPHQGSLALLQGLDMDVALEGDVGSMHQRGIGALLTGMPLGGRDGTDAWAAGPSVDQVIAQRVGADARVASLELGVVVNAGTPRARWVYRAAGEPLAPENDPRRVYERLFGDFASSPEALARQLADRGSVLDHVGGDLEALRRRLGTDHRHALDAHLASVRDVEHRLGARAGAGTACTVPDAPGALDPTDPAQLLDIGQLQMKLLVRAMACDLTRVGTVFWSSAGQANEQTFPWIGVNRPHHPLSHLPETDGAAMADLIAINRWYARQLRFLLDELASVTEPDGSTLLDNTIVLWGSELSVGRTHSLRNMHWVLAGGGGGALRMGQWLRVADRPHNDLLLTICHAMGLTDLARFGDRRFCSGPIAELLA
jgi:hypothetical protein